MVFNPTVKLYQQLLLLQYDSHTIEDLVNEQLHNPTRANHELGVAFKGGRDVRHRRHCLGLPKERIVQYPLTLSMDELVPLLVAVSVPYIFHLDLAASFF